MNYELLVRKQAKAEVRKAARWYEKQRLGLGREFVAEIDDALHRLADNPLQYQAIYKKARRAVVRRFPYGIFYLIEEDAILVFASPTSGATHCSGRRASTGSLGR